MNNRAAGVVSTMIAVLAVGLYMVAGPSGGPGGAAHRAVPHGEPEPALRTAIESRRSGVMVTLNAEVARVLPDDNDGSRHQRLILALDEPVGGVTTVLIAHNIDLAERVPCGAGDRLVVRGQYEWNDKGGVIHWTHHDPGGRREGGWIVHEGVRFE